MNSLLIVCFCLLVVVSGKHHGTRSKKIQGDVSNLKSGGKIHGEGDSKIGENSLIPVEKLLLKFRKAVVNMVPDEKQPKYPAHGKVLQRNRKLKNNKNRQKGFNLDELQASLESLSINFNILIDSFEETPEGLQLTGLKLILSIFINWDDQSNHVEEARRLKLKTLNTQQENAMNEALISLRNFLSTLIDYLNTCGGQEAECLLHLTECMKEQQERGIAKKRYGPEHNYLLDAVKVLAHYLEELGDPCDDDILLLAKAVNHLFEDVNILISNPPTVESNVLVTVDLYNFLALMDICKQNEQCNNDWYRAFAPEFY